MGRKRWPRRHAKRRMMPRLPLLKLRTMLVRHAPVVKLFDFVGLAVVFNFNNLGGSSLYTYECGAVWSLKFHYFGAMLNGLKKRLFGTTSGIHFRECCELSCYT